MMLTMINTISKVNIIQTAPMVLPNPHPGLCM